MIKADYTLFNCPCCNSYAHSRFEDFGQTVWIECDVCGLQTRRYNVDDMVDGKTGGEQAIECWNRRA